MALVRGVAVVYAERDEHVRTLRAWHEAGIEVTYVKRGDVVVLMDELAYLKEAFEQ